MKPKHTEWDDYLDDEERSEMRSIIINNGETRITLTDKKDFRIEHLSHDVRGEAYWKEVDERNNLENMLKLLFNAIWYRNFECS